MLRSCINILMFLKLMACCSELSLIVIHIQFLFIIFSNFYKQKSLMQDKLYNRSTERNVVGQTQPVNVKSQFRQRAKSFCANNEILQWRQQVSSQNPYTQRSGRLS
uniref:Uncharacterized protein n=1 Tax=Octopus bimaculoides TaxID=37653 RepID=A0A0L8GXH0_OCTBM